MSWKEMAQQDSGVVPPSAQVSQHHVPPNFSQFLDELRLDDAYSWHGLGRSDFVHCSMPSHDTNRQLIPLCSSSLHSHIPQCEKKVKIVGRSVVLNVLNRVVVFLYFTFRMELGHSMLIFYLHRSFAAVLPELLETDVGVQSR